MTEADSVHSTPRKTASKSKQPRAPVPFPKAKKPLPIDRPSRLMAVERSGLSLTLVDNDASHRANAPRTLTAWICRDPAPGRSALDLRQEA